MNNLWSILTPFSSSVFPKRVGFEDVLFAMKQRNCLLMNTMPREEQDYLIAHTIRFHEEETRINNIIDDNVQHQYIVIIYGRNTMDETIEKRYSQMIHLGFHKSNVWIYYGGLFEYSMLQEMFGQEMFPSIGTCRDLLKYKPKQFLH